MAVASHSMSKTSHFQRLDISPTFIIDENELQTKYFALQSQTHPDKLVGQPAEKISKAQQDAAAINDAYTTLKDPLRRAEHLLQINGFGIPEQETLQDPELLMEMMELRESATHKSLQVMVNESFTRFNHAFSEQKWSEALQQLLRLKYLHKILIESKSHG